MATGPVHRDWASFIMLNQRQSVLSTLLMIISVQPVSAT
jgi:hypothetical protein